MLFRLIEIPQWPPPRFLLALHPSAASVRSGEFLFAETQIASVGDCKHTQPPLSRSCRCHRGQKPPVNTHPHLDLSLKAVYFHLMWESVLQGAVMGAFGVILRSLHCMGLYIQLSASLRQAGSDDVENHISNNGKTCGLDTVMYSHVNGFEIRNGCHLKSNYARTAQWWRYAEQFIISTTALGLLTGGTVVYDDNIVVLEEYHGISVIGTWWFTLVLFV